MSGLETLLIKAKSAARRGDADDARALYRQVLDRFPANKRALAALQALDAPPEAANSNGGTPQQRRYDAMVAAYQAGRMADCARDGALLARECPHVHGVHNLQGAALLALGDNAAAEAAFARAIAADPAASASYNNLAIAQRRQGRLAEAEATYRAVIARAPAYADARYNLANLLEETGRGEEAAKFYAQALDIDPGYVDAHYNLGNLHAQAGRRAEAIACYEAAIALRPDHSDAHNNKGSEFLALERADEALAAFDAALQARPDNAQALVNKGKTLVLKGALPDAVSAFRAALALNPADGSARLQALFEEGHMCDWSRRGEYALTKGAEVAAVQPFASLPFIDDPEHQYRRSLACATLMSPGTPKSLPAPAPSADGRIRIGYFSADLHDHATMYLMSGLFRSHDRSRFDIHFYSYGPVREDDGARIALKAQGDAFTEIGAMTDEEVVTLARAANLDIAIDLKGYTRGTRTRLFGHRLAPVQVSYMGYPGTLGHACMDYFIADPVALPEGGEAWFSEKIVRLPHSYQANDNQRAVIADTRGRAGWGLPDEGFVFASFNHTYKITPREWDIWMRLLTNVEGSVLWLLRSNAWAEENLRREAEARGVDPARLVFASSIPHAHHLGRLAHADLFLDTFAVNAHTTASDALWAGLPVLTLAGRQFAARVAASLVSAAGLPEMAVSSESEYEAVALSLANQPERLAALRERLAANLLSCPLFDTEGYTCAFERALETMHRRHQDGHSPEHFSIA